MIPICLIDMFGLVYDICMYLSFNDEPGQKMKTPQIHVSPAGFRESKNDTRAKATEDLAFDELHYAPHEELGMEAMAHL